MADSPPVEIFNISPRVRLTIIILFSCQYFTTACAYAVIAPFFPIVATQRRISHNELGIIFALYSITKAIFSPIVGIFLPRLGVRYALWAGLIIESGSTVLFGFLPNILDRSSFLAFSLVIRAVQGVGSAFYQTAGYSYITAICQDSVATTLGILEISTSIGFMTGPLIGGALYSAGGFKLPFIVLAAVMFVASCVIVYILPPIASQSKSSSAKLMMDLLRIPRVVIICIGLVLLITSITFIDPSFTLHLKPLHLSKTEIGLVFLSLAAAYGLFSPITGYICDRIGFRLLAVLGFLGIGVSLQFLGPAPYLHLPLTVAQTVLAGIAVGASFSLAAIPSFPDILEAASNSRYCQKKGDFNTFSVTSGLFNGFIALGQILGPIVGGTFVKNPGLDFEWLSSILGFIALGQAVIIFVLTIWEGTSFLKIRSVQKDEQSKEAVGDDDEENESKPLLA